MDQLIIHSPTERHLGCFRVLSVMNKATANICGHAFVWMFTFSSFGQTPRSATAGLYGKNMFSFVRNVTVSPSGCTICIPARSYERSCCPTSSPTLSGVGVLDFGHSSRYVVGSDCCNLHFLMAYEVEHFSCACLPSIHLWRRLC